MAGACRCEVLRAHPTQRRVSRKHTRPGAENSVEVGTALTGRPPHRTGRAELPHPALALGRDASSLDVCPPMLLACHVSGPVSGAWSIVVHSPWPVAFPPSSPPRPVPVCSRTSQVLCNRPTAYVRTSSACVLRLPDAAHHSTVGKHRLSRFPRKMFPCMYRVSDRAEPATVSRWRRPQCCLPMVLNTSALRSLSFAFHGSIPDLHVPRSTLRLDDCSSTRMTWGQPGSLDLDC